VLISTPYLSDEDKFYRDQNENKKSWLIKNDFYHYIGKSVSDSRFKKLPKYLYNTPYDPPSEHNYRAIEKVKWMDSKRFVL
jgi:hypothetical protein